MTRKDELLIMVGVFDAAVDHADLGRISKGTVSFEYYWLDRWYNVFRFLEPDGSLRNLYCNICMPPKFNGGTLDYVDLDIDLVIWPDARVVTLDEADFADNAAKYQYPPDVTQKAFESVDELKQMIANREFPFEIL